MFDLELWKKRKKELGLTLQDISDKSGVPKRTVDIIFSGTTKNPRIDTVDAIEKALCLDNESLIRSIGDFDLPQQKIVKVYGEVVCGLPVEAWETDEGTVSVDYKHPEEYFGLKVKGDSMINVGIRPGSILIIHKQSTAENGDIVVACVNGESTVKRLKIGKDFIVLLPENNNYEPILVPNDSNFKIFGKVVECKVKF